MTDNKVSNTFQPEDVLSFWFDTLTPKQWWQKDSELDQKIGQLFSELLHSAAAGELFLWRQTARGRLAEIIVLDQFSRNIYRDKPQAFAQDSIAVILAQEAITSGALTELSAEENSFLLMPLMHSESQYIHQFAEPLFAKHTPKDTYQFELKHKQIIDDFGRYPHRNEILNRVSTPDEIEFLKQPGSGF